MATIPEKIDEQSDHSSSPRIKFPWVLALGVLVLLLAIVFSFDSDRSLSERNGVVSQTEAENGVIPSIAP
ncbi:hypothetical protein [Hyphomicrobium sp. 99]|uniref:hypothetical protein n=1 Tax=Hyphomicrobium sp. 99 TaxID=1163419 RepID=UPI0012E0ADD7|nr:hypothetical protein [Hyphomicrobium sp. 99]